MINREHYVNELLNLSKKSQLIALYGRRRVGKTCLVRHCFERPDVDYMEVTGLFEGSMKQELEIFTRALSKCFFKNAPLATPNHWFAAFELLNAQLITPNKKLRVVFFDELPWLTTKRSGLLSALDHYWNTKWSKMSNLIVIVCGSAASWMLDKIINAKGGLHNRLTKIMNLKPFNLHETKKFLLAKKIRLSDKNILDIYMIMGGIPYYLEQLHSKKSVAQNINQLCFHADGLLFTEFPRLFRSLFVRAETHLRIIKVIAQHRCGISRQELIVKTKIPSGSNLNNYLYELIAAGFINQYTPYGYQKKEIYYRVIDEYTLFYLNWIEPLLHSGHTLSDNHWQIEMKTPAWRSWSGYAFESICLKHTAEIVAALKLGNVGYQASSWRYVSAKKSTQQGAQIDLLLDRNDDAITLCEIKYTEQPYILDKTTAKALVEKKDIFIKQTQTQKQIFQAFITTFGLKPGLWNEEVIDEVVDLASLFK